MKQSSPRIAVFGSINLDIVVHCAHLPQRGETVLAASSEEVSGGKGANQAVAAARLGGRVTLIGRVGDDVFGERLLAGLSRENLDTSLVWSTANCANGLAVVAVEASGENSIMVVPGANGKISKDDVTAAADAIRSCHVLLMQLEAPLEAVAAAIATAQLCGVRTILNPAPAHGPLSQELLRVDVLCPNLIEAAALLQRPLRSRADALQAAVELNHLGPKLVVITLGSDGAVYCEDQRAEWIAPFMVEAVDTTAAGDAFAGALTVQLAEGAPPRTAIRFACAAGALAATKPGAQPSLPFRVEVEALLNGNP